MRLQSKHKHIKTGRVYELQMEQRPVKNKTGTLDTWLILKAPEQKYPVSISKSDFELQYEPISAS